VRRHYSNGTAEAGGTEDPPAGPQIAIIGMSGRFPMADDVHAYWRNIVAGRECFTEFTDEELIAAGEDPKVIQQPNYVRHRPVLNDIRSADAGFFGISPREATLADPQQLIFCEVVWEVLESAGYGTPEYRGSVGVFAGMNISTYLLTRPNAFRMGVSTDGLMVGNDKDALATNVAYRLDLRGPAVSVQTFCSTSLTAFHMACNSVRLGECDMALAGGVSIRVPDRVGYVYHEGDLASPDGHVRAFDIGANGSMYGDGCAIVLLKRLDRALADRDTVLAVVRGSAINNDGALKFSFQAPSVDGQRRSIGAAIAAAGVDPADISYVEAHGTATEVGDPIEVAALTSAFGPTQEKQYCLLGSVKPNVGHLDRASGVTGLIKVVQSLRHELIPGTVNYTAPNAEIDFAASPFRVTATATPWPRQPDRPRIAGLNSLGTGGTNVHAIITEAPEPAPRPRRRGRWQILPLSARTKDAADEACTRLAGYLADEPGLDLGDVAFSLQAGRKGFQHRRVVIADSEQAAVTRLSAPETRLTGSEVVVGREAGFLIAGVGEQYPGMVADLYEEEPTFRADVDECVAILGLASAAELSDMFVPARRGPASDLAALLGRAAPASKAPASRASASAAPAGKAPASKTPASKTPASTAQANTPEATAPHLIQPAIFVAEYALARLLGRWGVQPRIMIGYSLGEYVAACLSGVLSPSDALRLLAFRAKLITSLPGGAMLAVMADERQLAEALGDRGAALDIAVRAGSQLVLAGPEASIGQAAATLLEAGIACRRLETTHAFHSRMLEPAKAELTAWIAANVTLHAPGIPYVSNLTGELATAELVGDPEYWARHMCETVQFGDGLSRVLAEAGLALVEIGPGRSIGALTRGHPDCPRSQWPLIVSTLPGAAEPRQAGEALAETTGRLWLSGVGIDWQGVHETPEAGDEGRERRKRWTPGRVPLPTYPFQRQEYWLEADGNGFGDAAPQQFDPADPTAVAALPRLPDTQWLSVPVWRQSTPRTAVTSARWLVFTDSGWADRLAAVLRERVSSAGGQVTLIRPGAAFSSGPDGMTARPGSAEDITAALRELGGRGLAPERVVHLWCAEPGRDGDDIQHRGLHTLIALAKAAGDVGLSPWSLDIVSSGLAQVLPGGPARAGLATLIGPLRVIPVEYPGTRTRLIDIEAPGGQCPPQAPGTKALLSELSSEPADQVVALHAGRRWVPVYQLLDTEYLASVPPVAEIRRGGTYLVTGGLGGIGLAMAERLAQDYQARLVLLTRTPVPPREQWATILAAPGTTSEVRRRIDGLRRLATLGAEVITVAGDVAKAADVRRAVNAAWDQFGALDGVLHCAGIPGAGMIQFKTAADVGKVLAPKMGGALALAEVLRNQPAGRRAPGFLALFSSTVTATGGGAGQADYCAANAFLDGFAAGDPVPGCLVTSIDWGEWTWNGWTAGLDSYDDGSRKFFEEYRARFGLSFDDGWLALRRVLASGEHHVVVSTQDFPSIVESSRHYSVESIRNVVRKAREALGRHSRPDLSTPYAEPESAQERAIADVWAEALGLEQVGVNDNFFELGGNSLIGMEIIAQVRTALGVPHLAPHSLYQAPTVGSLAEVVVKGETGAGDGNGGQPGAVRLRQSRIEQRRSMLRSGRTA
jgi:acyl transferase domain-containing protein/NAD(P)-dependent dehydrogenase (short-subunit alcohol dehydrogenase family)